MGAAVFLYRDGTVIVDKGYLGDPAGVELERGAASGLRAVAALGYALIVVTNQSGIARGLFSREAAEGVNRRVAEELAREGVAIADWYVCPHGPDDRCRCRKPQTGLIDQAVSEHHLDISASYVIGDKQSDLLLARAAGATGILVMTGDGTAHSQWALRSGYPVCAGLPETATLIRSRISPNPRPAQ